MRTRESEAELLQPPALDARSTYEWRHLAGQVLRSRSHPFCSNINVTLLAAAGREPQSPAAPAYRLWIADNLARDEQYADALAAYDSTIECAQWAGRLFDTLQPAVGALYHKAQTAALAKAASTAIAAYRELAVLDPGASDPLFQAGLLAESKNDAIQAADFYRAAAGKAGSGRTDDPAELARRALQRLEIPPSDFAPDARQVADLLVEALEQRDIGRLRNCASKTHFAVGPLGGHTAFETDDLLEELCRELKNSRVRARRTLFGSGDKLYLHTRGWRGKWFRGDLILMITRAPKGWQWTGLGIATPNGRWLDRWRPAVKEANQPLPFELLAPWPSGMDFTAGGLRQFAPQLAAVIAAGWPGGRLLALWLSRHQCGFGPRGLYYHQIPTHDDASAFAIDFTRYRRFSPYENMSKGTPVLAAREGMVKVARGGTESGSPSSSNTVEIEHADPGNPTDLSRFTSRYLHLEGPFGITVSEQMPIFTGNRLGLMDDTGDSILDHLHFSIHDRQIPHPSSNCGASVRPTPMSGVRLEDGDSGTCVRSTNVEHIGASPMAESEFAVQNWLLTPAASAANESPPAKIQDQLWLIVLSGIAVVDLKGNSEARWRRETVSIRPHLHDPLQHAVNRYQIPTPSGLTESQYLKKFQVEQWAPYFGLGAIYNEDESNDSGFSVTGWRPNPFSTGTDIFFNATHNNLFEGIQVDIGVRDTDAWLHNLSYSITLLGKIVLIQPGPIF